MNDGDLLIKAVIDNPADNTPRLIFADWLDENGDPLWADLIRRQIDPPVGQGRKTGGIMRRVKERWYKEYGRSLGSINSVRGFADFIWGNRPNQHMLLPMFRTHPITWICLGYAPLSVGADRCMFRRSDGALGPGFVPRELLRCLGGNGTAMFDEGGLLSVTYSSVDVAVIQIRQATARYLRRRSDDPGLPPA